MRDSVLLKGNEKIMSLKVFGYTDKGVIRPHNEDFYGHFIPADDFVKNKWGSLFAVSDGVGGNAAGEVASAEAVNVLLQEYYFGDHTEKAQDRLKDALEHVTQHIYDLAKSSPLCGDMMCTLTAVVIKNDRFHIAHIGDSKAFLLRSSKLVQLTRDHSLVGKLVRLGLVTPEAARTHPNKHVLLRSLGGNPIQQIDFQSGRVMAGDLFCLITDGILEHLTAEELRLFLLEAEQTGKSLKHLIDEANKRGGFDNMTIMTVKVGNDI